MSSLLRCACWPVSGSWGWPDGLWVSFCSSSTCHTVLSQGPQRPVDQRATYIDTLKETICTNHTNKTTATAAANRFTATSDAPKKQLTISTVSSTLKRIHSPTIRQGSCSDTAIQQQRTFFGYHVLSYTAWYSTRSLQDGSPSHNLHSSHFIK